MHEPTEIDSDEAVLTQVYVEVMSSLRELIAAPAEVKDPTGDALRIVLDLAPDVTATLLTRRSMRRPRPLLTAATDPLIHRMDTAQLLTGQGPVVAANRNQITVCTDDVTQDPRWPLLARQLAGTPRLAAISQPIREGKRR